MPPRSGRSVPGDGMACSAAAITATSSTSGVGSTNGRPFRDASSSSRNVVWNRPASELRLLEQPREKRQRGLDAGDDVFAERAAHARDRARPILGPRDELRDHRVVENRDVESGRRAAVVADAGSRPARAARESGPATAENGCPDLRRRCGTRSRAPSASGAHPDRVVSRSPRAMRICHCTRSSPVTISVIGCSTCSRVFISRRRSGRPRRAGTRSCPRWCIRPRARRRPPPPPARVAAPA